MMDEDEGKPKRASGPVLDAPPLDAWSIDDMQAYIAALQAEITRAEAAIARKQSARGQADSFFRR